MKRKYVLAPVFITNLTHAFIPYSYDLNTNSTIVLGVSWHGILLHATIGIDYAIMTCLIFVMPLGYVRMSV
jgi:hypothetical protein